MKSILTIALTLSVSGLAAAQTNYTDTIQAHDLQEVVIAAPKVIHKADMDVYNPSKSAVENSKNGVQLLANLMIPSLSVSDALGTITSSGQEVQVRINGRTASVDDVKKLLPSTIKRVEWIENPGLRYNGANTVLNFIVENPTIGGSIMLSATQALNMAWGNYIPSVKFNFGKSQVEIGGYYKLTENLKAHRDYKETFTFPDETSLTRHETSLGGELDASVGKVSATYSYIKPDTTIFVVEALSNLQPTNHNIYNGLMSSTNGSRDILLTDITGNNGARPSISAYLEQHFAHRQLLVVDFKSQYYVGRSFSDYIEQEPETNYYLTDIHTNIKDRNQLYAIEADYIKNWKKSRLTAGVSYRANRNRSTYENLGGEVFHQRQDRAYFFAEYFQRINKVSLTAGLGIQYTDFMFKETNLGSHSWNIRPQASIVYRIVSGHQLRLNFDSWQTNPSLTETNPTPQQIDGLQWRIGNPGLKTSNSYRLTLRYDFRLPRVYGQFGIKGITSPNYISPFLQWEGDKLVTTYENSKGLENLTLFLSPQIEVIPDWLMVSGYLQWRTSRMSGTGYRLTNSSWSGNASLMVTHWGFTLSAQYVRASRNLSGQKVSWGEDLNIINLTYNWKQWGFSAGCILPFGKYDTGSKLLSHWNNNEQHLRLNFRIPYISISYNLQWGRQKRNAKKLVNLDGEADQSKAGGK